MDTEIKKDVNQEVRSHYKTDIHATYRVSLNPTADVADELPDVGVQDDQSVAQITKVDVIHPRLDREILDVCLGDGRQPQPPGIEMVREALWDGVAPTSHILERAVDGVHELLEVRGRRDKPHLCVTGGWDKLHAGNDAQKVSL